MNGTEFPQAPQLSARHIAEVVKHALQIRSLTEGASKIKWDQCKTQEKIEKYHILPQLMNPVHI